jgi:putative transcriptional regulator
MVKRSNLSAEKSKRVSRVQYHWPRRIVAMRQSMGLSQTEFSKLVGVSLDTLQNWEQSRRQPSGPAAVLLTVLERDPESVLRAMR